jgi:predicted aconitase with swiveling domain
MIGQVVTGERLVAGSATGEVLHSDVPLSFWGGVDPVTGVVIDTHDPLHGERLTGRILAIPAGRGSCGGSATIFEMLLNDTAPAALVFSRPETILTVGVVIAEEMFGRRIPVLRVDETTFSRLKSTTRATIADESDHLPTTGGSAAPTSVALSPRDQQLLDGDLGEAARIAMRIVLRAAALEGASQLIDVQMAHIEVFYQGPASLAFATTLRDLGGRVSVPATTNPICIDRSRWRELGVPASMGEPSEQLADAYVDMGAKPTYTCAPYLLRARPGRGQQIASGESNAVVYLNSVVGARTMTYPNYLDLLVAITGRAPDAGTHRDADRRPTVRFDVPPQDGAVAPPGFPDRHRAYLPTEVRRRSVAQVLVLVLQLTIGLLSQVVLVSTVIGGIELGVAPGRQCSAQGTAAAGRRALRGAVAQTVVIGRDCSR